MTNTKMNEETKDQLSAKDKRYIEGLTLAMIVDQEFSLHHGMTAPYTHSYEVRSPHITQGFCSTITTSKRPFTTLPQKTYHYLRNKKDWIDDNFERLQHDAQEKLLEYRNHTLYEKSELPRVYDGYQPYTPQITKQIMQGKSHGDFSTMTTISQNILAQTLLAIRGEERDLYKQTVLKELKRNPQEAQDVLDMMAFVDRMVNRLSKTTEDVSGD